LEGRPACRKEDRSGAATFRELAEAIGSLVGATPTSITVEQAQAAMGPMAAVLASSASTSSAKARATFGWTPDRPSILDDVRAGSYRAPVGQG
jgi:nucleoside-diphosphate-sugar epimerase